MADTIRTGSARGRARYYRSSPASPRMHPRQIQSEYSLEADAAAAGETAASGDAPRARSRSRHGWPFLEAVKGSHPERQRLVPEGAPQRAARRRGAGKKKSPDVEVAAETVAFLRAMASGRRDSRVQGRVKRRWRWDAEDEHAEREVATDAECVASATAAWQDAMAHVLNACGGSKARAARVLDTVPQADAEPGSTAHIAAAAIAIATDGRRGSATSRDVQVAQQDARAAKPPPADALHEPDPGPGAGAECAEPREHEAEQASKLQIDGRPLLPGTVIYRSLRNELAVLNERHSAIAVGADVIVDVNQPLKFSKMIEIVLRDGKSPASIRARWFSDVFVDDAGAASDGVSWHAVRDDGEVQLTLRERMRRSACALLSLGACWFNPVTSSCWHHTNAWSGWGWRPGRPQDVGILTGEVGRLTSSINGMSKPLSTEDTATSVVKIATALLSVVVSMRQESRGDRAQDSEEA